MVAVLVVFSLLLVAALAVLTVSRRRLAGLLRTADARPLPVDDEAASIRSLGAGEEATSQAGDGDAEAAPLDERPVPKAEGQTPVRSSIMIDAQVLWAMERLRSERTWRYSVSAGPDTVSVFAGAVDALVTALQVEVDAAREEVGTVVELEADVPSDLSEAASLMTLRCAQELLAPAVRLGERATLRVRADEQDIVMTVTSIDENDNAVRHEPIPLPPSDDIEVIDGGLRLRRLI